MPKGIGYHNKDVLFKVLSQNYKDKSFEALGLNLPKIKKVLPANLPDITANELRADNIFLLEDDRILIVEYESTVKQENFIKYLEYILRVVKAYSKSQHKVYNIVVAVIYTGDILEAADRFIMDSLQINIMQVFLSKFSTEELYADLKQKVETGNKLSDEDIMKFIILPLTEPINAKKQELVEKTISLAKYVDDEQQQVFIVAGILVATDKFINKDYSNMVKEWIKMTKVARLFEEEKIEYANKAASQAVKIRTYDMVKEMLMDGEDILKIMKYSKLTKDEILAVQDEINLSDED